MKFFPMVASFIAGTIGWELGRKLSLFAAIIGSLVLGVLGFYYARKYQKETLGD